MGQGRRRGPSDALLRLADLRANQSARRTRVYPAIEVDELAACKRLAYETFGDRGVVEFDTDRHVNRRLGVLRLGYFIDPPSRLIPKSQRRVRILFQGASHRELVDQVRAWSAAGRKDPGTA